MPATMSLKSDGSSIGRREVDVKHFYSDDTLAEDQRVALTSLNSAYEKIKSHILTHRQTTGVFYYLGINDMFENFMSNSELYDLYIKRYDESRKF
jgi:hypothetical protein